MTFRSEEDEVRQYPYAREINFWKEIVPLVIASEKERSQKSKSDTLNKLDPNAPKDEDDEDDEDDDEGYADMDTSGRSNSVNEQDVSIDDNWKHVEL